MSKERSCSEIFFKYIVVICRAVGIIVMLCVWSIAVSVLHMTQYKSFAGWYLIAVSIVLTIFESFWIIDMMPCIPDTGRCAKCWEAMLWVEDWRKTLIYTVITIPLFLQPHIAMTLVLISNILVLTVAGLYLIKSFDCRHESEKSKPFVEPKATTPIPYRQLPPNQNYNAVTNNTPGSPSNPQTTVARYNYPEPIVEPDPGPQRRIQN